MDPSDEIGKLYNKADFLTGLCLAISSSVFIGSSFVIKKLSLQRLGKNGSLRAGAGGYGYLKDWLWWTGLLTMGIGELANFAAYAFAPASLVTPLGALSVLISSALASKFLNEKLHLLGKFGCGLCVIGSIIIIIHSPKEHELESMESLLLKLKNADFFEYLLVILGIVLVIVFHLGPRYGNKFVVVYVCLCSAIGSLTVMACKALGLSIKSYLLDPGQFNRWPELVILFICIIFFICVQMNYLNKALDLFSTNIVTPVYYVMFTTLVIIASSILFKEWQNMKQRDILGALCGFTIVIIAIYLISTFKDNEKQSIPLLRYNSNTYVQRHV